MDAQKRAWLASVVVLLLVGLGTVLRFHDLAQQCLGGDELHAVRAAANHPFWGLFTYYGEADNSIPLSLLARFLMDGAGLTELRLRAPIALTGFLLLLSPLLFRRALGRAERLLSVALIAVSPPLVYFSFVARPYAPGMLLTVLSFFLWDRWMSARSWRAAVAFGGCAALSCFFHLYCVFTPLFLFLFSLAAAVRGRVRALQWSLAAGACAVVGLALLGPGLDGLIEHRAGKVGGTAFEPGVLMTSLSRLTGLRSTGTFVLTGAALLGGVRLVARDRIFGVGLLGGVLVQWVALLATQPFGGAGAWSRYLVLVWPLALMLVAAGLEGALVGLRRLAERLRLPPTAPRPGAALFSIALVTTTLMSSPIGVFDLGRDSFRTSRSVLGRGSRATEVPDIYHRIAEDPGAGDTVLECPNLNNWTQWSRYRENQRVHGKWARMVSIGRVSYLKPGMAFRNLVPIEDEQALAQSGARYLVLHLEPQGPGLDEEQLESAFQLLEERYGEPVHHEQGLAVFHLGAR